MRNRSSALSIVIPVLLMAAVVVFIMPLLTDSLTSSIPAVVELDTATPQGISAPVSTGLEDPVSEAIPMGWTSGRRTLEFDA